MSPMSSEDWFNMMTSPLPKLHEAKMFLLEDAKKALDRSLFTDTMRGLGVRNLDAPVLDSLGGTTCAPGEPWDGRPGMGDIATMLERCQDFMRCQDAIYGPPIKKIRADAATAAQIANAVRVAKATISLGVPLVIDDDVPPGIVEIEHVRR